MSNRRPRASDGSPVIEWTPQTPAGPRQPPPERATGDILIALFGIILPAAVIAIEATFRLCAEAFFDPMPTWAHLLLIASVPATNAAALLHIRRHGASTSPWLQAMLASSIAIAGFYALLFLPLAPIAVVAILFYGLGLLPFGPATGCLSALALLRRLRIGSEPAPRRPIVIGALAGLTALVVMDIPGVATRLGLIWAASSDTAVRERGLTTLRTFGSQQDLLRFTYDTGGKSGGPLSLVFGLTTPLMFDRGGADPLPSTTQVREIFYRTYGVPFNTFPPPHTGRQWARFGDFAFDADHGGTQTGGRVKGLSLASSRLDGSVSAADAVGYLEWIFEFRNASELDREARLSLMLPQGAVVSRAALWVNGEEREAAYAGRAEARRAYEQVAVQQRRDPLLVTTKGAGRVLAQAFPVPRNGTLKMKIGMSIPLLPSADGRAAFSLPAISDRNFTIPGGANHAVWIESPSPVTASSAAFKSVELPTGATRLEGTLTDTELSNRRPEITVSHDDLRPLTVARIDGAPAIEQRVITPPDTYSLTPLLLVIDGSARIDAHAQAIAAAMANIAPGRPVGLLIAAEPAINIASQPWSEAHARRVRAAISNHAFTGGQDNTPALAQALRQASASKDSRILWIHGPQPVRFESTAALLEQTAERIDILPAVDHYAVEPGPNELWPDAPWAWRANLLPAHGDTTSDLARYVTGKATALHRAPASTEAGTYAPRGSEHIARLWAHAEVLDLMTKNAAGNRAEATQLAADLRLVTPVSGAVVLETAAQYAAANLSPVEKGTVPTVPEPHEWALIILAMALLGYLVHRQRTVAEPAV